MYSTFIIFGIMLVPFAFAMGSAIIKDRKIQKDWLNGKEPLSEDEKNQCLIKILFDITSELKGLKSEKDVKIFLETTPEEEKSFHEATPYSEYDSNSLIASMTGVVGALLGSSSVNARNLITSIDTTRRTWKKYLLDKIVKDNTPKEEKKKFTKEIESKINYLLNSKVLLITKQDYIKDAWVKILTDKTLKIDYLDGKANLMIYRDLIDNNFHTPKI